MVFPFVVLVFDFEEFSEEVLHGHCVNGYKSGMFFPTTQNI
jgi:hypothetical protein